MKLTLEDTKKVQDWLKEKAPALRCFCCGNGNWTLGDRPGMTIMFDAHTGRIHYMDGYPMIGLICTSCAHIVWFSAPMIGLKPEQPSDKKPIPAESPSGVK